MSIHQFPQRLENSALDTKVLSRGASPSFPQFPQPLLLLSSHIEQKQERNR